MDVGLQGGKRLRDIASDTVEQLLMLGTAGNGIAVKLMWML
jgi:hypothetical protein